MAWRTVPGIGSAFYSRAEEALVRRLLAGGSPTRHNEVAVFHACKVYLGARLVEEEDSEEHVQLAFEGVAG
jgi:hypothetical protein